MKVLKSAAAIQVEIRRRTLDLRAIDRLIQNPEFPSLWNGASVEDRRKLLHSVNRNELEFVRQWFEEEQVIGLDDLSRRELVDLARFHRVKNYSRMTKERLLRELRRRDVNDETIQDRR